MGAGRGNGRRLKTVRVLAVAEPLEDLAAGEVFLGVTTSHDTEGNLHAENGPAVVRRYGGGAVNAIEWWLKGRRHRGNGPAVIRYYPSGRVASEEWWDENKRDRADGPAVIVYDESGAVVQSQYWRRGREVSDPSDSVEEAPLELQGIWRLTGDEFLNGATTSAISLQEELGQRGWEGKRVEAVWEPSGGGRKRFVGVLALHAQSAGGIRVDNHVFFPSLAGSVTVRRLEDETTSELVLTAA